MSNSSQCLVIVSDSGESWGLSGDEQNAKDDDDSNDLLPGLLSDGWSVVNISPGSGAKDDTSYWLVLLEKK